MKEKLEKCPLCGAKVVDAYNSITKQFYYKCENSGCHFRLPKNYTEQEVSLQGIELKAECGGCGSPLTIACGPNGLYATCLRCNYDLRPNMVYGFVFKKHANAHNPDAEQEIKELKEAYKGIIDEDYSFDDFLGTEEEVQENFHEKEIISEIFKNINREEFIKYYNKGYSINQLSQQLGVSKSEIRGAKKVLLKEGVISTYVNKNHPRASLSELENNNEKEQFTNKMEKSISIEKVPRKGSLLEVLVDFFKENMNKGMSAQTIHEKTGIKHSTLCNYLTQLRKTNTIKIVGYEGNANPYTILYALKESPLEELKTVEDEKYITPAKFFKKYAKNLAKINIQLPLFLNKLIEEQNLESFMTLAPQGLRKVYLESELLTLIKKDELDTKVTTNTSKTYSKENYFLKIGDMVLSFLRKNISTPYTIQSISKATNMNENSVSSALKLLREQNKVKIVDSDKTKMMFQITDSPLPELDLKSDKEYISLYNFYQNNKNVASSLSKFKSEVASVGLPSYKIITRRGIGDGYSIEELKKLFLNKTEIKSKEVIENADIPVKSLKTAPINHKKNFLGFVTSVFKNKNTISVETGPEELISF